MIKRNKCSQEGCNFPVFARKKCKYHDSLEHPDKYKLSKSSALSSGSGEKSSKKRRPVAKKRKPTGELSLFLKIYAERGGKCEITGQQIPFNVNSFAHILGKGSYPSLRLNPDNIIHVIPDIHDLYDNQGRDKLLAKYPDAIIIYEKKDKLRYQYYNE